MGLAVPTESVGLEWPLEVVSGSGKMDAREGKSRSLRLQSTPCHMKNIMQELELQATLDSKDDQLSWTTCLRERGAYLTPLWRARLTKERSGLVSMARTPEHQPILMELSLKAPMLEIGHSMVLKLLGDSNKVAASKASDDINL